LLLLLLPLAVLLDVELIAAGGVDKVSKAVVTAMLRVCDM
jgi:hypothetical protein